MQTEPKTLEQELADMPFELLQKLHDLTWKNFEIYEILADQIGWQNRDISPSLISISQAVGVLNGLIAPFTIELLNREGRRVNGVEYFRDGKIALDFLPTPIKAESEGEHHD